MNFILSPKMQGLLKKTEVCLFLFVEERSDILC